MNEDKLLINKLIDLFKLIDSINFIDNTLKINLKATDIIIPTIKINVGNIKSKTINHIYTKQKPQEVICGNCKKIFIMTGQEYRNYLIQKEYGNVRFPFCCSECKEQFEKNEIVKKNEFPTIGDLLLKQ